MGRYSACALLCSAAGAAGHGAMVFPPPRSAHNQTLDDRNKCGAEDPYSKVGLGPGEYCGIGCLGDACLYYQVGCYAGCPTCSLSGKDLYPTAADLKAAGNCQPIEPTLGGGDPAHERELRTHNIDGLSQRGDWTKVNPWRAPGSAGRGNPDFQPCGVNSGGKASSSLPPTTAKDVPKAGPGTALPSYGSVATWTRGATVEAAWAIYANHAGGYSYRLCKKAADGSVVTEACFQATPLDFASDQTEIRYVDGSARKFKIPAVSTSAGTFPKGSMWRKNPVPMCSCDLGFSCGSKAAESAGNPDDKTMFLPYSRAYNKTDVCPTGSQFPPAWGEGAGGPPYYPGYGMEPGFQFMMVDELTVPAAIPAGEYVLSLRWDCEETPQVWNSCSDITVV